MGEDRFGKTALELGLINEEQLADALNAMKQLEAMGLDERLGSIMVRKGYLTKDQVKKVLAAQGQKTRTSIAGYEIVEKIGEGAMGPVYKARQTSMDRLVALKVLPPSLARDKAFLDRFMTEAKAAARLSHPNIIQGIDVGQAGKYYYFAMEYVDGRTLAERLKHEGSLAEAEAVTIIRQVAEALAHAWRNGIIHRDIKPDNIMMTTEGVAKLSDLGLAKRGKYRDPAAEGTSIGTPHYISPEQARGEEDVDIRSDIYSLGATLYHLLVGRPPFEGNTAAVVMTKHLTEELPSPQDLRPELSDGVCDVIERMMAKEPEDRYPSPLELTEDLKAIEGGKGAGAGAGRLAAGKSSVMRAGKRRATTGAPAPEARRPVAVYVACGAGAAVLLVVVAILLWPPSQPPAPPLPPRRETSPPAPVNVPERSPLGPQPAVTENPEDPPETPALSTEDAKRMYEAARDFAGKNPDQFWEIFRRFEQVRAAAAGTVHLLKAEDELKAHRARQAELRAAETEKRKASVQQMTSEDRFAEARVLFESFPRDLLEDDTPRASFFVEIEKRRIDLAAKARHEELVKDTSARLSAVDLAAVRANIERLKRIGYPKLSAEIPPLEKKLAEVEADAQAAKKAAVEHARRVKFVRTRRQILAAAGVGSYDEALKAVDSALNDPDSAAFRPELAPIERALKAVQHRLEEVTGILKRRADDGAAVTLHKRGVLYSGVKVTSVEGGTIKISAKPSGEITLEMSELSAKDIIDLADLGTTSSQARYEYGVLLYFQGRSGAARPQFEKAAEFGEHADDAKCFMALIDREPREAKAAEMLSLARSHYAAQRWADAKKLLEELKRDYSDTDIWVENLTGSGGL